MESGLSNFVEVAGATFASDVDRSWSVLSVIDCGIRIKEGDCG